VDATLVFIVTSGSAHSSSPAFRTAKAKSLIRTRKDGIGSKRSKMVGGKQDVAPRIHVETS
jgi:hypothetical protein